MSVMLSCFVGWELHIYFVLNYVYIMIYVSVLFFFFLVCRSNNLKGNSSGLKQLVAK